MVVAEQENLLTLADVLEYTGASRATIYRWMAEGSFPRPIKIGERANRWLSSDLSAWLASRSRAVIGGRNG